MDLITDTWKLYHCLKHTQQPFLFCLSLTACLLTTYKTYHITVVSCRSLNTSPPCKTKNLYNLFDSHINAYLSFHNTYGLSFSHTSVNIAFLSCLKNYLALTLSTLTVPHLLKVEEFHFLSRLLKLPKLSSSWSQALATPLTLNTIYKQLNNAK